MFAQVQSQIVAILLSELRLDDTKKSLYSLNPNVKREWPEAIEIYCLSATV
jgi:hypothetical protein